jgi:drug/metabolite transporter (DMT)-like permease
MNDPNLSPKPTSYQKTMSAIAKDLHGLRVNIVGKLSREVLALQSQKQALTAEIEQLRAERKELEVQIVAQQGISQQEIQRQQWIEQLARAIAIHLRSDVENHNSKLVKNHAQSFDSQLINLDRALHAAFHSLQKDVGSYSRDLNEQMLRMHSQTQRGEALLEALVERLDLQLRQVSDPDSVVGVNGANGLSSGSGGINQVNGSNRAAAFNGDRMVTKTIAKNNDVTTYVPSPPPAKQTEPKVLSNWWRGLILVLLASLSLSLQNVLVRVIFVPSQVIGMSEKVGGLVPPGIGSSFMLLFMRMVFAMPLMWLVATQLFKVNVANDLNGLINNTKRGLSIRVVFSAILQFVSFALMFTAFSFGMKPAVVVTIFFLFPVFTSLMSWFFFGDRIPLKRGLVIGLIVCGILLTQDFFSVMSEGANINWVSFGCAVTAAITFAGYIITSAACFKQINPVSFTAINFIIVLLLSGLCIGASLPFQPSLIGGFAMPSLWGMCALVALTTMGGYLFTNFGTKLLGAAPASLVSSSGPVFTTLLAWILINDQLSRFQVAGVFIVTLGVLMLSLQNMTKKR